MSRSLRVALVLALLFAALVPAMPSSAGGGGLEPRVAYTFMGGGPREVSVPSGYTAHVELRDSRGQVHDTILHSGIYTILEHISYLDGTVLVYQTEDGLAVLQKIRDHIALFRTGGYTVPEKMFRRYDTLPPVYETYGYSPCTETGIDEHHLNSRGRPDPYVVDALTGNFYLELFFYATDRTEERSTEIGVIVSGSHKVRITALGRSRHWNMCQNSAMPEQALLGHRQNVLKEDRILILMSLEQVANQFPDQFQILR